MVAIVDDDSDMGVSLLTGKELPVSRHAHFAANWHPDKMEDIKFNFIQAPHVSSMPWLIYIIKL